MFCGKLWTKTDTSIPPKSFLVSVKRKDVSQPDGAAPGWALDIMTPLDLTIEYDIPSK